MIRLLTPDRVLRQTAPTASQFKPNLRFGISTEPDSFRTQIRFGQESPPAPKKDLKTRLSEIKSKSVPQLLAHIRQTLRLEADSDPAVGAPQGAALILDAAEVRLQQPKAVILGEILENKLKRDLASRHSPYIQNALQCLRERSEPFTDANFEAEIIDFSQAVDLRDDKTKEDVWRTMDQHELNEYLSHLLELYLQPREQIVADYFLWNPLLDLAKRTPGPSDAAQAVNLILDNCESHLSQKLAILHEAMLEEMEDSPVWQQYREQLEAAHCEPHQWHSVGAGMTQWQSPSWPYLMQTLRDDILPQGTSIGLAQTVIRVLTENPNEAIQSWCIRSLHAMHMRGVQGIPAVLAPHRDLLLKLMETTKLGQRFEGRPMAYTLLKQSPDNLLPMLMWGHEYLGNDDDCANRTRKFIQPENPEQTLQAATALGVEMSHMGWQRFIQPQDWPIIHQALEGLWDRYLLGERELPETLTRQNIYALTEKLHHANEQFARILFQVAISDKTTPAERLQAFDVLGDMALAAKPDEESDEPALNLEVLGFFKEVQDALLASADDAFFLKAIAIAGKLPHEMAFRDHLGDIGDFSRRETRPTEFFLPKYVEAYLPYAERLARLLASPPADLSGTEDNDTAYQLNRLNQFSEAMATLTEGRTDLAGSVKNLPNPKTET